MKDLETDIEALIEELRDVVEHETFFEINCVSAKLLLDYIEGLSRIANNSAADQAAGERRGER